MIRSTALLLLIAMALGQGVGVLCGEPSAADPPEHADGVSMAMATDHGGHHGAAHHEDDAPSDAEHHGEHEQEGCSALMACGLVGMRAALSEAILLGRIHSEPTEQQQERAPSAIHDQELRPPRLG